MSSQSLELVLSAENDSLCSMSVLNTKIDWPGHFRLLGREWERNTILRAVLSYLGLFSGQSLCPGGCPLFCFRVCLCLVCLDMLMISWSGMPQVCVLQILFCSFPQWDWVWHSLVLGLCVAEAGLVPRLPHFSVQSSRRLHLNLGLPTFLRTNYFVLCGFTFGCTATDPMVAISVNDLASWISLFSPSWHLQAL